MLNNSRHCRILWGDIFALSEKQGSCEDNKHITEKRSYMADGIVTNTIMAAPDTLLGVVKIGFIIYKLAKNTN